MLISESDTKRSCAEMEVVMAPAGETRRKKTRRGKKRQSRCRNKLTFGCSFEEDSFLIRQEIRSLCKQKNILRPSSPKAPMNSTQFLIEDSGNDRIDIPHYLDLDMDTLANSPSPDHALNDRSEMVDFDNVSLYEDHGKTCQENDREYSLMCFDETTEFVGREFERDFQAFQDSGDDFHAKFKQKRREFSDISKETLVKKYIKLEKRLLKEENRSQRVKHPFLDDLKRLLKENESLQRENIALRSLLS